MADLGGVRGVQMHPPLAASNVFCVHNCTSPCSNNNQAQIHTHVSVPYWSPDVWLGLELLRDIQFGPRGPPRRASAYEISKSTGFHVDFGFQSRFLGFTVDFWISVWISADRFLKTLSDSVRDLFCDRPLGSAFQLYIFYCMNAFTWPKVGVATQKFSGALRAPVTEPPFLNF